MSDGSLTYPRARLARPAAAALAAVAALAMPATATAQRSSARACTPAGSKTIAANASIRVFYRRRGTRPFVCGYRRGRQYALPQFEPGGDRYGPVALNGRWAAIGHYPTCGVCIDEDSFVRVINPVAGRTLSWRLDFDDDGKAVRVTDVVVSRRGAAAWIRRDLKTPADVQVQKGEPAADEPALLDSGPGIERGSLALAGTTLYWTNAGVAKSARLGAGTP